VERFHGKFPQAAAAEAPAKKTVELKKTQDGKTQDAREESVALLHLFLSPE